MTARTSSTIPAHSPSDGHHGISLSEATRLWARIAALSFGGPAGQIAEAERRDPRP